MIEGNRVPRTRTSILTSRISISARSFANYTTLSIFLLIAGASIIVVFLVVQRNYGIIALGLATLLIAVTMASLPRELESSEVMKMMLEEVALSTEKILESIYGSNVINEEEPQHKDAVKEDFACVFLPPVDGLISVYLPSPVATRTERYSPTDVQFMMKAPFVTAFTFGNTEMGFRIYPVGFTISRLPELSDAIRSELSLQDALGFFLIEKAQICSSLDASEIGDTVVIELDGVKCDTDAELYLKYIGSIPASLAASIAATIHARPVTIIDETGTYVRRLIRLRIWSEH